MPCPKCEQRSTIIHDTNQMRLRLAGLDVNGTHYFCPVCEQHLSKDEFKAARARHD